MDKYSLHTLHIDIHHLHPFTKPLFKCYKIISTFSSYVKGLDKYENAVERGLNGQSCEELYAECPYSIGATASSWGNLFKRR